MCLTRIDEKAEKAFERDEKGRVIAFQAVRRRVSRETKEVTYQPIFYFNSTVGVKMGERKRARRVPVSTKWPGARVGREDSYRSGFHGLRRREDAEKYRAGYWSEYVGEMVVEVRLEGELTFGLQGGDKVCVGEYRTIVKEV